MQAIRNKYRINFSLNKKTPTAGELRRIKRTTRERKKKSLGRLAAQLLWRVGKDCRFIRKTLEQTETVSSLESYQKQH